MKKIISVAIAMIMILSMIPFTVFAADEVTFTLRIESETDNELTLVLDCDKGTGFSALDIDISYDRIRLELKSCEKGEGYAAFEKYLNDQGALSICSINSNENPVKVSMANTIGFKTIDGKKSIVKMNFAKVPGTKFAKEDVTLDFTNCQTAAFSDIKVNFDYDLTAPSNNSEEKPQESETEYPQQTSADNVDDLINDEINEQGESNDSSDDTSTGADENKKDAVDTKMIIIIVAAVCVAGIVAFVFLKIKSKKKK